MLLMEVFLYIAIFIMGSVFGSFFTLAVYRLPRKENITYVRSHCTSCNHDLNFWDMIPIWSYVFLGGKCRYCKEKIRSRYICLEIFSGLVFSLIALSLKISTYSTVHEFINLFFIYLFMCAVFIIGGIDKEKHEIHDGTILYGIVVSLIYGLYNAVAMGSSMKYAFLGFIAYPLIFLVVDLTLRQTLPSEKLPIGFGDIEYLALIGLFLGFGMQSLILILAVIFSVLVLAMRMVKKSANSKSFVPFGFYLSIATAVIIIFTPFVDTVADLINISMI